VEVAGLLKRVRDDTEGGAGLRNREARLVKLAEVRREIAVRAEGRHAAQQDGYEELMKGRQEKEDHTDKKPDSGLKSRTLNDR